MKAVLLVLVAVFLYSCSTEKMIEANFEEAKLVRVDTVQRFPNLQQKLLTWETSRRINYITYEDIHSEFPLGYTIRVMVAK